MGSTLHEFLMNIRFKGGLLYVCCYALCSGRARIKYFRVKRSFLSIKTESHLLKIISLPSSVLLSPQEYGVFPEISGFTPT